MAMDAVSRSQIDACTQHQPAHGSITMAMLSRPRTCLPRWTTSAASMMAGKSSPFGSRGRFVWLGCEKLRALSWHASIRHASSRRGSRLATTALQVDSAMAQSTLPGRPRLQELTCPSSLGSTHQTMAARRTSSKVRSLKCNAITGRCSRNQVGKVTAPRKRRYCNPPLIETKYRSPIACWSEVHTHLELHQAHKPTRQTLHKLRIGIVQSFMPRSAFVLRCMPSKNIVA